MKKIIAFSSMVLLAIFGLVACGTNSKKLSKENIDRIHFTITNGSNYQFQETDMNIKEKKWFHQLSIILMSWIYPKK